MFFEVAPAACVSVLVLAFARWCCAAEHGQVLDVTGTEQSVVLKDLKDIRILRILTHTPPSLASTNVMLGFGTT